MKSILIIGGGWLGKPLAHYLQTIGHKVAVSHTTEVGVSKTNTPQLNAIQLDLQSDLSHIIKTIESTEAKIVIGCFPPGFRSGSGDGYAINWDKLTQACKAASIEKVIMVSSTSVYPNIAKPMVEDDASLSKAIGSMDFDHKAVVMLQAEQHVIDSGISYGIVRCSGLVGPNRHPSRFISKMKQVSSTAPANMLHLTDAIGAISFVTALQHSTIVNATTPNTVNKAEFYQAALDSAQSEETLPPLVTDNDKQILAVHLQELGYKFHYCHTLELV
ncbi:nucleoside-diphosphate sugar epimerase [Vibrio zhanjiangensis]|uniref:Nucleoside-diphosphate sugar epimerase n=1 Tax=Vibrio zhanjiangensis TaxID=1046128 RepID=A0ABQ6EWX6_9VIBR|nr:NAD-dependent epimerase/dehydratase family protein [Vibrio zhanjiangensis]GLT17703.1 nucleoside-diphosphate sugar epimerase [Vibrio zhanjiangensis]